MNGRSGANGSTELNIFGDLEELDVASEEDLAKQVGGVSTLNNRLPGATSQSAAQFPSQHSQLGDEYGQVAGAIISADLQHVQGLVPNVSQEEVTQALDSMHVAGNDANILHDFHSATQDSSSSTAPGDGYGSFLAEHQHLQGVVQAVENQLGITGAAQVRQGMLADLQHDAINDLIAKGDDNAGSEAAAMTSLNSQLNAGIHSYEQAMSAEGNSVSSLDSHAQSVIINNVEFKDGLMAANIAQDIQSEINHSTFSGVRSLSEDYSTLVQTAQSELHLLGRAGVTGAVADGTQLEDSVLQTLNNETGVTSYTNQGESQELAAEQKLADSGHSLWDKIKDGFDDIGDGLETAFDKIGQGVAEIPLYVPIPGVSTETVARYLQDNGINSSLIQSDANPDQIYVDGKPVNMNDID